MVATRRFIGLTVVAAIGAETPASAEPLSAPAAKGVELRVTVGRQHPKVDPEWGLALGGGVGGAYPLGRHVAFIGGLRYLWLENEFSPEAYPDARYYELGLGVRTGLSRDRVTGFVDAQMVFGSYDSFNEDSGMMLPGLGARVGLSVTFTRRVAIFVAGELSISAPKGWGGCCTELALDTADLGVQVALGPL